jgi:hypothetical protein
MRSITVAAVLTLAAAAASAAGTVNVTFVEPEKYYDAGNSKREEPENLKILEQFLQQLGQRYLPDGQVLNISVLDVDLAGYLKPSRRTGDMIRIARGGADWPRITVRYELVGNGQTLKKGDEAIADLNYARHGQSYANRDPLRHEKQMLEGWFRMHFTGDYQ